MKSNRTHWDNIFSNTQDSNLGWYEDDVSRTFELLDQVPKWQGGTVFLTGAGTSIIIEDLLDKGASLILNDISMKALDKVKDRLGTKCKDVHWTCQDIADPLGKEVPDIDVWIDRAVLHFLTDENDIRGYFKNVTSNLKPEAHAIFAEFSKTGASRCAGLNVHRYSVEELSERLDSSFKLISHFNHDYINPSGDPRPYIYALFKKMD